MARFNAATAGKNTTVNYEGEKAYKMPAEMELYSAVCTASLQPKFYVPKAKDQVEQIRGLVGKVDHEFTAKLAVYAREQMYLRSIPLVLAVELAKVHKGDGLIGKTVARVVQRADEITELLSYYQSANPKKGTKKLGKVSNQIIAGLKNSFNRFDEYAFAKYERVTEVKLRDALFIVHPKPKDKAQEELFKKIADKNLETAYTWETELSAKGNKSGVWEGLIDSGRLPYMAMLRNLRNILQADVKPEHLKKVLDIISDPERVKKSRQLPFRFFSAYREVSEIKGFTSKGVFAALEKALVASAQNIPFDEKSKVVVACDDSGSMDSNLSEKSKIKMYEIGFLLGAMLAHKLDKVLTLAFSDNVRKVKDPGESILSWMTSIRPQSAGTNGWTVLAELITKKLVADKVFFFTDMQLWNTGGGYYGILGNSYRRTEVPDFSQLWNKYKQTIAPEAKLYIMDLAGYGTTPISIMQKDVYFIAGWSDKIFDVLNALEKGSTAIKEIEKIEI
jgi:60 kDa SS-A/Ro ribonucleoprotein